MLSEPLPKVVRKKEPVKVTRAEWAERAERMFNASDAKDKREELAGVLGVAEFALEELQVGVGHDWNGQWFWSFPERDVLWRPVGIKRRYPGGAQKHMPGAAPGLYMAREWWIAPGPVFLPEGGSDVAALLTMGLCAVGRSSNTGSVERLIGLLSDCKHKPIVVIGENDRKPDRVGDAREAGKTDSGQRLCSRSCTGCAWCWPGRYGAVETAERLTAALRRRVYFRMVNGAKDTRAWLNCYGRSASMFVESLKVPAKWLASVEVID